MRITVSMLLMVLVLLLCSTIKTISLTSAAAAAAAAELNPTWTGQTGSWRPRLASSHIKLNLSLTQKCAMLLKRFSFRQHRKFRKIKNCTQKISNIFSYLVSDL